MELHRDIKLLLIIKERHFNKVEHCWLSGFSNVKCPYSVSLCVFRWRRVYIESSEHIKCKPSFEVITIVWAISLSVDCQEVGYKWVCDIWFDAEC